MDEKKLNQSKVYMIVSTCILLVFVLCCLLPWLKIPYLRNLVVELTQSNTIKNLSIKTLPASSALGVTLPFKLYEISRNIVLFILLSVYVAIIAALKKIYTWFKCLKQVKKPMDDIKEIDYNTALQSNEKVKWIYILTFLILILLIIFVVLINIGIEESGASETGGIKFAFGYFLTMIVSIIGILSNKITNIVNRKIENNESNKVIDLIKRFM